jgi:hypothetical protein
LLQALAALIPRLPAAQLGLVLAVIAVPAWITPIAIQIESVRAHTFLRPSHVISRILLHQVAAFPALEACYGWVRVS